MPSVGARWLFDGLDRVVQDALLVWEQERIVGVYPGQRRLAQRDLGDAVLLPGLVNAHTHLDLSAMQAGQFPGDACSWLNRVVEYRRQCTPESVRQAVQQGITESLRHGVTLVGDIATSSEAVATLAQSPLRATIFCEILGLSKNRARQSWQQARAIISQGVVSTRCRYGLSPHAPYSTRRGLFRLAARQNLPVAVHLAEFREEQPLLESQSGPFRHWLEQLGAWDADGLCADYGQILDMLRSAPRVIFVHFNYPTGELLERLANWSGRAGVVFCPRTHAYFGHAPHPWLDLLHRGIRVAIGTDSRASSPDLSVLGELRFVWQNSPALPARRLWRLATSEAAALLGWPETGALVPGRLADFIAIPLRWRITADPLQTLLETDTLPSLVCINGRVVFDATGAGVT